MKKLISFFLAVFVVLSISAFVFADENLINYRWVDVEKNVQETFGSTGNTWLIKEVDATIWFPSEYSSLDPAQ